MLFVTNNHEETTAGGNAPYRANSTQILAELAEKCSHYDQLHQAHCFAPVHLYYFTRV